jgi:hypothetical protein
MGSNAFCTLLFCVSLCLSLSLSLSLSPCVRVTHRETKVRVTLSLCKEEDTQVSVIEVRLSVCLTVAHVTLTPAAKHGQALVLQWLRLQVHPAQRFLHSLEHPQNFSHICSAQVWLTDLSGSCDQAARQARTARRTMPLRAHPQPFSTVHGRPGWLHGTYSGSAFSPRAGSATAELLDTSVFHTDSGTDD